MREIALSTHEKGHSWSSRRRPHRNAAKISEQLVVAIQDWPQGGVEEALSARRGASHS
jgi:hypothetical protein